MEAAKRLDFGQTLKGGLQLSIKNAGTIIAATILYVITAWIPYINIGTTIAFFTVLPVKLGKGESFSPTEIFDAKYRENMSDFFLVLGLLNAGVGMALLLFLIPGIIITWAWMLAAALVINEGVKPFEALKLSYNATYGSKWPIFFSYLIIGIIIWVIGLILGLIATGLGLIATWLGVFVGLIFTTIVILISFVAVIGLYGHIYTSLITEKPGVE